MAARLQILGSDPLVVDESAKEAAQLLGRDAGRGYAHLHRNGKPVLVNPASVAWIEESGEAKGHSS